MTENDSAAEAILQGDYRLPLGERTPEEALAQITAFFAELGGTATGSVIRPADAAETLPDPRHYAPMWELRGFIIEQIDGTTILAAKICGELERHFYHKQHPPHVDVYNARRREIIYESYCRLPLRLLDASEEPSLNLHGRLLDVPSLKATLELLVKEPRQFILPMMRKASFSLLARFVNQKLNLGPDEAVPEQRASLKIPPHLPPTHGFELSEQSREILEEHRTPDGRTVLVVSDNSLLRFAVEQGLFSAEQPAHLDGLLDALARRAYPGYANLANNPPKDIFIENRAVSKMEVRPFLTMLYMNLERYGANMPLSYGERSRKLLERYAAALWDGPPEAEREGKP